MTRTGWILALILGATFAARAQDAPKKDAPPKPPLSPSKAVLETWNDVARKLTTMAEDFPEDKYDFQQTPADIVAFVKKAMADGANAIQAKGDSGMNDLLLDPFSKQQVRVIDFAYGFIEHMGEHYGQLAVYYRVAGLVPPESRPKK